MTKTRELKLGMRCVKYMIFVANFMFMLIGFLLISIGYTIKAIYNDFDAFLSSHNYKASDLTVAVGIIILIVALFGCIGALKGSVCLVNLYALLLLVIVILEVAITITAYRSRSNLQKTVKEDMLISMDYYPTETNYIWRATQYNLHCCGVNGPSDWNQYGDQDGYNFSTINSTDSDPYYVPASCCVYEHCNNLNSLYFKGCLPKIIFIISQSALLLGVGAMCITFIQILGAIFAHLLARSIRKLKTQIELDRSTRRQELYESLSIAANLKEKTSPVLYVPSSSEA
ncbi:tetraspanin-9-like [Diorhabda carinulata]|uniref:tetraspanin-9-like n=1 Tax=Diorhabda carinulata TaxID=1163345 RepID=UPI0025A16A18|nr:tetraspanin-9-like [Diorhabda carinulata]